MADKSNIEWTDATWNSIVGCSIVSPGCTNCYAMGQAARIQRMAAGAGRWSHYNGTTQASKAGPVWTGHVTLAPNDILTAPLRWRRPRRIFVNSMGDLFHENVPDEWIDRVFAIMALAPQHTYQVLTKRAGRMGQYMTPTMDKPVLGRLPLERIHIAAASDIDGEDALLETLKRYGNLYSLYCSVPWPLPNVWLGVSVEDQRRADERREDLSSLAEEGWNTFVSYEPALGPVDWTGWEFLRWLISGGESGPDARPNHPDWHRATRDFGARHGIPYLFKQWGAYAPLARSQPVIEAGGSRTTIAWPDGTIGPGKAAERGGLGVSLYRGTKSVTGRMLDGVEHNAMPEVR